MLPADMNNLREQEMGASHHWCVSLWKSIRCLTFPSWCGSVNVLRCVDRRHLIQCRIHPRHYFRVNGKCVECQEEWSRKEQHERKKVLAREMEKKAKDNGGANLRMTKNDKHLGPDKKLGKNNKPVQKTGKWQTDALEANHASKKDQEHGKGKSKALGPDTHKAKKKWRDEKAALAQVPH